LEEGRKEEETTKQTLIRKVIFHQVRRGERAKMKREVRKRETCEKISMEKRLMISSIVSKG